jgi:hypothetical protein
VSVSYISTAVVSSPKAASGSARMSSDDDVDGLVQLLTDDAWLAMPPAPHEYHGPTAIGDFWRSSVAGRGGRRFRLVPTRANTQPAFACYLPDHAGGPAHFTGLLVLTLTGRGVGGVTRFLDGDLAHPFAFSRSLQPTTAEPSKQERDEFPDWYQSQC